MRKDMGKLPKFGFLKNGPFAMRFLAMFDCQGISSIVETPRKFNSCPIFEFEDMSFI